MGLSLDTPLVNTPLQSCESLLAEHQTMEGYLDSWEKRIQGFVAETVFSPNDKEALQELLKTICHELNTHFACEEQVLFPAVSPYHPMVLMEAEHEELLALRTTCMDHFNSGRYDAFVETSKPFITYLREHMARENGGIFPVCEQALTHEEKQQVIDGMNAIRTLAKIEVIPDIMRPEKTAQRLTMPLDDIPERPVMVTLLAEKAGLHIKHLTLRAGEGLAAHWSTKQLLVWCVRGKATFTADLQPPMDLAEGTGVLVDPQLSHAVMAQTDCHLLLVLQDVP